MNNKFFVDLKTGLKDVVDYQRGKLDLWSEFIELPKPPISYKAKEIKNIRKRKKIYRPNIYKKF